jgi:hypothetical protein
LFHYRLQDGKIRRTHYFKEKNRGMVEDIKLIQELKNKIGCPLKQGQFDELLESKQDGYTIDEKGIIIGLCLFNIIGFVV